MGVAHGRRGREGSEMTPGPGRRWLVGAVGLFLLLFVLWVLAVFQLSPASAGAGVLQLRLRSNLAADYTAAPMVRMLRTLRLTVMQDVMQDMGMTEDEASAEMRAMAQLLESPVPTATARDLMGEAPFTPTATRTAIPTDMPEPTATSTRRPPPTATETEKPTKKPRTPTPDPGPIDDKDPDICCTDVDRPEGPLPVCTIEFLEVEVFDPAYSEGVAASGVYGRADVDGDSDYANLSGSGSFSAGFGSDWSGTFSGTLTITHGHVGDEVIVFAKAKDIAGNGYVFGEEFVYTLEVDCDS